jgi:hypothetical protein
MLGAIDHDLSAYRKKVRRPPPVAFFGVRRSILHLGNSIPRVSMTFFLVIKLATEIAMKENDTLWLPSDFDQTESPSLMMHIHCPILRALRV